MVQYKPLPSSLTEDDLPETDNQPVDNELQVLIPILLRAILALLWAQTDWFLGVNIGLYYDSNLPPIGPDSFLSLGVPRYKSQRGRLSYVVAQENNIVPQWVLEVVSKTPGDEYIEKMTTYAQIGVLYYTIYNPDYWQREQHDPFEVYRLVSGNYVRQYGNPVWMPEIGLGIGYEVGAHSGWTREWLYWYDGQGNRHPAPEDVIEQEQQLREAIKQQLEQERRLRSQAEQTAEQERQIRLQSEHQLQQLLERLRQQEINPDETL